MSSERSLPNVLFLHPLLMITRTQVGLEHTSAPQLIRISINLRRRHRFPSVTLLRCQVSTYNETLYLSTLSTDTVLLLRGMLRLIIPSNKILKLTLQP